MEILKPQRFDNLRYAQTVSLIIRLIRTYCEDRRRRQRIEFPPYGFSRFMADAETLRG